MLRARPAVLALCVFAVGFAVVWAGVRPDDPIAFCPELVQDESVPTRAAPQLWPPGTLRCEFGSSSRTYVPWREWLVVALLAAAVGVAATRRFAAAAGLGVAAFVAYFFL